MQSGRFTVIAGDEYAAVHDHETDEVALFPNTKDAKRALAHINKLQVSSDTYIWLPRRSVGDLKIATD